MTYSYLLSVLIFWELSDRLGKPICPPVKWYFVLDGDAILNFLAASESPIFSNLRLNLRPSVDTPLTIPGLLGLQSFSEAEFVDKFEVVPQCGMLSCLASAASTRLCLTNSGLVFGVENSLIILVVGRLESHTISHKKYLYILLYFFQTMILCCKTITRKKNRVRCSLFELRSLTEAAAAEAVRRVFFLTCKSDGLTRRDSSAIRQISKHFASSSLTSLV